ncbi:MAG: hypothetical protein Q9224_005724, partial [Gallowayella concinna]
MAEVLDLAATIVSLLQISSKVTKSLTHLESKHDDHRRLEFQAVKVRISLSLEKFKAWQEIWFEHATNPGISPVTLWGSQASITIKYLIDNILQTSKVIEQQLSDVEIEQENQPRPKWKQTMESLRNKQRNPNIQKLYDHGRHLSDLMDELWIFSDTAFDLRHGLSTTEMKPAGSDRLLESALHSRAGSLELFRLCSMQTEDCNLEMDLYHYGNSPCYRLVTEPSPRKIRRMVVESLLDQDVPAMTADSSVIFDGNGAQLFQPSSTYQLIKVPPRGSTSPAYLRISGHREAHSLESSPRSLREIIKHRQSTKRFPMEEILPRKARIALAFKVTESTLYLLGTPWLSSLNSTNLRHLDSAHGEHPAFILRTPTSDLEDLLSDDPAALSEKAQLFRLGILLIEIALGLEDDLERRKDPVMLDHTVRARERFHSLPQVEKAMGLQYCTATAFCLQ